MNYENIVKAKKLLPVFKMVDSCAGEFRAATPYFYSTYEWENESKASEKQAIIVLGSGPIRIGQGIEFDYATVHCVDAIQKAGYKAIVINNNPETVSTDFSISDKLYFEPLTLEDVLNVTDLENPLGVIVQFGGQTAINLAAPLTRAGVHILGTSLENLNRAEDRDLFEQTLESLGIAQPLGTTATNEKQASEIAQTIGYPVLVRPSYVLGGRAMQIIQNSDDLKTYMKNAGKTSYDHPVLIDRYLNGKECEVDAICDGQQVLIPGIMEHIEKAGVHSGDSMAVYPPQSLSAENTATIVAYTKKLVLGLKCKGIMNIQFVICDQKVYVIEANPRASRTLPFLSKVTGIPMAQLATAVILGENLKNLGYNEGLYPSSERVHVKAPVFSFSKLLKVETALGPEMKSTGEVMGSDISLEKALYKAFEASGLHIPTYGSILFTIADQDKFESLALARDFNDLGFSLMGTKKTAAYFKKHDLKVRVVGKVHEGHPNVLDVIRQDSIQMVINTIANDHKASSKDGFMIRRQAVEQGIVLFTSLDTAQAILRVIKSRAFTTQALS